MKTLVAFQPVEQYIPFQKFWFSDVVNTAPPTTRVIGSPDEEGMAFINSEKARRYIRSLPKSPRVDFAKVYPVRRVQVEHIRLTLG